MPTAALVQELKRRQAELSELCATPIRTPSETPPGDTTKLGVFSALNGLRPFQLRPARLS